MNTLKRKDGYSKEQIEYLREISKNKSNEEITKLFNKKFNQNRSMTAIIQIKHRNNIKSYTRVYTKEQIKYLKKISKGKSNKEITKLFNEKYRDNRTEASISTIRVENNIRSGVCKKFKKGHRPANSNKVGTIYVDSDGYKKIKTAEPNEWKYLHREIYKKHHGEIPRDHVVLFGDKDITNLNIENLLLVSKAQLLGLNRHDLIKKDVELTKTGVKIVDLSYKISEVEKECSNE